MELHLHLGAHKTASTHLQASLIRDRDALARRGVAFAPPSEVRALVRRGREAAARLSPLPSLQALFAGRRLLRLGAETTRLVLSDENSLGRCAEMMSAAALYPSASARIRIWRPLAAQRETTIYLAIRDYAPFFSGAFAQSIRDAAWRDANASKIAALSRRWPHVINEIRQALPDTRLILWNYADHEALAPDLLARMTGDDCAPVRRRPMATPSQAAIDALRGRKHISKADFETAARTNPIGPSPRFSLFNTEQQADLSEQFNQDLAQLRGEFGADFLSPKQAPA